MLGKRCFRTPLLPVLTPNLKKNQIFYDFFANFTLQIEEYYVYLQRKEEWTVQFYSLNSSFFLRFLNKNL